MYILFSSKFGIRACR